MFRDIEFQDGGAVGFAVGTNGAVWRSGDAGDTWVKLNLTGGRATQPNRCDLADEALGDADSIRFAGPARAWIVAGGTQIFRTVTGATAADVGSVAAGWEYINDNADDCKVTGDIDDLFPIGDSGAVYFIGKSFGGVFFTSNALDTTASKKPASAGNGFEQVRRVTGDPANPNRQWPSRPAVRAPRSSDARPTAGTATRGGPSATPTGATSAAAARSTSPAALSWLRGSRG